METDDQFAQWATLFIRGLHENETDAGVTEPQARTTPGVQYVGVTHAAGELLRSVDAGGVPAFVTSSLKQIAADNGIAVTLQWTPNEIVEAIREKASIDASEQEAPSD
ncbi:MAG: hypothetical protein NTY41_00795 [Proteobacteria bacterium]|nr:hypothetical protein [Pseudomonadota bacterium]